MPFPAIHLHQKDKGVRGARLDDINEPVIINAVHVHILDGTKVSVHGQTDQVLFFF